MGLQLSTWMPALILLGYRVLPRKIKGFALIILREIHVDVNDGGRVEAIDEEWG